MKSFIHVGINKTLNEEVQSYLFSKGFSWRTGISKFTPTTPSLDYCIVMNEDKKILSYAGIEYLTAQEQKSHYYQVDFKFTIKKLKIG